MNLHQQHCFNHPERPAAARCPQCGHVFCRECVNEHEGRFLCAPCLRHQSAADVTVSRPLANALQALLSLIVLTLTLYLFFRLVIRLSAP